MLTPRELALAYDRFVAARWRGEEGATEAFAVWLEAHWTGDAPPEPDDCPDAVSFLGGAGAGIRWYAAGGAVLGYVAGRQRGCYWVPLGAAPPPVRPPVDVPLGQDAPDLMSAP